VTSETVKDHGTKIVRALCLNATRLWAMPHCFTEQQHARKSTTKHQTAERVILQECQQSEFLDCYSS